ncbi:MAG: hypothetical protein GC181_00240 [Bacteroidetes bacterium]|nr:hypothetical protein [Bacteroidota bacterium]
MKFLLSIILSVLLWVTAKAQIPVQYLLSQSQLEISYQSLFPGTYIWKPFSPIAATLNYLPKENDPIGIAGSDSTSFRPMDVSFHKTRPTEKKKRLAQTNCHTFSLKWWVPLGEKRTSYIGISALYTAGIPGKITRNFYSDVPFGNANTLYYTQSGVYDEISVHRNSTGVDTTYQFTRTKLVSVQEPQKSFGLGLNLKLVLAEDPDKKWLIEMDGGLSVSSTFKSPVTVYYSYFDYYQNSDKRTLGTEVLSSKDVLVWNNPVNTDVQSYSFVAPPLYTYQFNYGLAISVKPSQKAPLRLSLRPGIAKYSLVRKNKVLAKSGAFSVGYLLTWQL